MYVPEGSYEGVESLINLGVVFFYINAVIAESSSIVKAEVESEDIRFFGRGRVVMLYFSTGYTLPLTEKCTLGDGR